MPRAAMSIGLASNAALAFAAAALALLPACGPAATTTPPAGPNAGVGKLLAIETADPKAALTAVSQLLTARGWKASLDPGDPYLAVSSPKGSKFGVEPMMSPKGEIDRLNVFKAFVFKPDAKGSPRIPELVRKLNQEVSGLMFSISSDGSLVCMTWVFFVDVLDPDLMLQAMGWLDQVTVPTIASHAPDLIGMLL
jgi:hypothetical protein